MEKDMEERRKPIWEPMEKDTLDIYIVCPQDGKVRRFRIPDSDEPEDVVSTWDLILEYDMDHGIPVYDLLTEDDMLFDGVDRDVPYMTEADWLAFAKARGRTLSGYDEEE